MGGLLTLIAVVAALAVAGGSAAAPPPPTISLAIQGNPAARVVVSGGATVTVLSRAIMRRGERIILVANRPANGLRRTYVCYRSPCRAGWREAGNATVVFSATLAVGGAVLARSRKVTVVWTAPLPPPPPPIAGRWSGRSSQNETWTFEVNTSNQLVNFESGQINESCTPPANLSQGRITLTQAFPINGDGSFSITVDIPITINTSAGSVAGNRRFTMSGRLANGIGSGTFRTDTSFNVGGTSFACSSGNQTWNVTKTG